MSDAPPPMNRREFLAAVATTAAVVSLPVLQARAAPRKKPALSNTPVDVGPLTDFAKDGVTDKFAKKYAFFVVRQDGKLFAPSAICTHRFATIRSENGEFVCHQHNSHFSLKGEVTDGPAETSLPRYAIHVDAKGHVIVEPSKEFAEAKWDDPAAFVKAS